MIRGDFVPISYLLTGLFLLGGESISVAEDNEKEIGFAPGMTASSSFTTRMESMPSS